MSDKTDAARLAGIMDDLKDRCFCSYLSDPCGNCVPCRARAEITRLSSEVATLRDGLTYMKARVDASLNDCRNAIQVAQMMDDYPALQRAKATGIDLERMLERIDRALATASDAAQAQMKGDGE